MNLGLYVTTGNKKGTSYFLAHPDQFHFGRLPTAQCQVIDDLAVSRRHFLLEVLEDRCLLKDLNSTNGTIVNGILYGGKHLCGVATYNVSESSQCLLEDRDEITVGTTTFLVRISFSATCKTCGDDLTVQFQRKHLDEEEYFCEKCQREKKENTGAPVKNFLNLFVSDSFNTIELALERYTILEKLGHGGMGIVYKGIDNETRETITIKMMHPHHALEKKHLALFSREANVTSQLNHPNVIQLHDFGLVENVPYFILEYIDGMDLADYVQKFHLLDLQDDSRLLLGILDGLAYAHKTMITVRMQGHQKRTFQGIIHRDLKPQNILLQKSQNGWIPKISDFGLAKSYEAAGHSFINTQTGEVCGTPLYWPREQILHYRYLLPQTDVFSIAAVFYHMLTGALPRRGFGRMWQKCKKEKRMPQLSDFGDVIFNEDIIPIRSRKDSIPKQVAMVIDKALEEIDVSHGPDKMRQDLKNIRFKNAGEFRDQLLEALKESNLLVHNSPQPFNSIEPYSHTRKRTNREDETQ